MRGKRETRPGSVLWTAPGCSGWVPPSCKRTQKLFTECNMHVSTANVFIMAISFCLWVFYFTYALRELILHKIIMNWYKLLLINMNDVLFSELETLRDTNTFNRHNYFFLFSFANLAFCAYFLFLVKSVWHVRLFVAAFILRVVFPVEEPCGVFVFLGLASAEWQEGLSPGWWIFPTTPMQPLKGNIYHNTAKPLIPLQANHPQTRGYYVLFSSMEQMGLTSYPPWESRNFLICWELRSDMM